MLCMEGYVKILLPENLVPGISVLVEMLDGYPGTKILKRQAVLSYLGGGKFPGEGI